MPKREATDTAGSSKRFRAAIHESMDEFMCPITHSLPLEPVLAEDGKVYERAAVEKWLTQHHRSPSTNLAMGSNLVPATQIRNMIEHLIKAGAVQNVEWEKKIKEQEKVEKARSAAESGDVFAAWTLGHWYRKGVHGLRQDDAKAHSYFLQAGDAGDADAMGTLADAFFFGNGVAKDRLSSLRWSAAGTALGNPRSIRTLALIYEIGMPGFPPDMKQAFRLSKRYCKVGAPTSTSLVHLAEMYADGRGTGVDLAKAIKTMKKAVERGSPAHRVQEARDWLGIFDR